MTLASSSQETVQLNVVCPRFSTSRFSDWHHDASELASIEPGDRHWDILRRLMIDKDLRAGLVTDAVLAAICIEHGLDIVSADSDFSRFSELNWINPVAR